MNRMLLIHRQIFRPAINLAGTRKDNLHTAIVLAAGFKNRQLRASVDVQVRLGIQHRIEMTGLASQIENIILVLDKILDGVRIAYVGDIDADPIPDVVDVKKISSILRNQAVNDRHVGAHVQQPTGEVGPDETQPSCNKRAYPAE